MCNLCYVIQEPKQVELKDPLYKLHKIYSPKQKKTIGKNHCIPKIDIKTTKSIEAMHPMSVRQLTGDWNFWQLEIPKKKDIPNS